MENIAHSHPKYSICISNYNMGDTMEQALDSILGQLNNDYEVLVIDDGSTDNSVSLLCELAKKYPLLRHISLQRNRKRKLGETRNISIREAHGEYVLLHLDADDIWEPYIMDFVKVFHRIETCLDRDFLLSGQQINMGRREFLLKHGPYKNIHRMEDRDMWIRLAAIGAYFPLHHRVFRTRLTRPGKINFFKSLGDIWHHVLFDLRTNSETLRYIVNTLAGTFVHKSRNFTFKHRIARTAMVIPAYFVSKSQEPIPRPATMKDDASFVTYREQTQGTYSEIMARNGCDPDLSFLGVESQKVFSEKPTIEE